MRTRASLRLVAVAGAAVALLTAGVGFAEVSSTAGAASDWTATVPIITTGPLTFAYPYVPPSQDTQPNIDFEYLMYRPLYVFGSTNSVAVVPQLSLATTPVWSNGDKTVTFTLKNYVWSNGEKVTPGDVIEFLNILTAEPSDWANYVPPLAPKATNVAIPDIIESVSTSGQSMTFNLNTKVSPRWFDNNELSQLTPLPAAWDIAATGWTPSDYVPNDGGKSLTSSTLSATDGGNIPTTSAVTECPMTTWIGDGNTSGPTSTFIDSNGDKTDVNASSVTAAEWCAEVMSTMVSFGSDTTDLGNFTTDAGKLYQIVDGPWQISTFDESAVSFSFVRNPDYSGPVAPNSPSKVVETPCTDEQTCYNLVETGAVTQGGLPAIYAKKIANVSQAATGQTAIAKKEGYTMQVVPTWSVNYFPVDTLSTLKGTPGNSTTNGAELSQAYVRHVLQELSDQSVMISRFENGYAYPAVGPVPAAPTDPGVNTGLPTSALVPFSISGAKADLESHGWKVGDTAGATKCEKPGTGAGECGAGISKGAELNFQILIGTGSTTELNLESYWAATCAQDGIGITIKTGTFSALVGIIYSSSTKWDLGDYGAGWIFSPDYYPTGEVLFAPGAGANASHFDNASTNAAIVASLFTDPNLDAYATNIAQESPVIFRPDGVGLIETKSDVVADTAIGGSLANPLDLFVPETWELK